MSADYRLLSLSISHLSTLTSNSTFLIFVIFIISRHMAEQDSAAYSTGMRAEENPAYVRSNSALVTARKTNNMNIISPQESSLLVRWDASNFNLSIIFNINPTSLCYAIYSSASIASTLCNITWFISVQHHWFLMRWSLISLLLRRKKLVGRIYPSILGF